MDEDRAHLDALHDGAIPVLAELLGPGATDLLSIALGEAIAPEAAKAVHVSWRPGDSVSVRYAVQRPGVATPIDVVAAAGGRLPDAPVVLGRGNDAVALWQIADDPALPGLRVALDPMRSRELLDRVDAPPGPVSATLRAYRPGRRAVVELRTADTRAFVKVVRPRAIAGLQKRHESLAAALVVPASHGWSPDLGLVVLEALPGETLRVALGSEAGALPAPASLDALLERIPALSGAPVAATPLGTAPAHCDLVSRVVPSLAPRLHLLRETFAGIQVEGPMEPVHGDFHEAQILTQGGAISGLLDIDTVALGYRADDWATLVGHLAAWREASPNPEAVGRYARSVLSHADARTGDPAGLRFRVAAVIAGLATGPFRVQMRGWVAETHRRVALAERWVESGHAAVEREGSLISVSSGSHVRTRN